MIPVIILSLIINQVYEVEGVVVTATRYPAMLKDVSVGTIVIDEETIEAQAASNIGEILHNLAGIDVGDYGSPGSVMSISIRGTPSTGVLILLDGIPLNSMQTGMADISFIDVKNIEQIEIIKGPVSSLYGANGIGGLVSIITKKNKGQAEASANIRYEKGNVLKMFDNTEYSLRYTIPVQKFYYQLVGKRNSFTGARTNSYNQGFSVENQFGFDASQFSMKLTTDWYARDYGLPGPQPLVDSIHTVPYLGDSTATSKFDKQIDRIWLNNLSIIYKPVRNLSLSNNLFGNLQHNHYSTKFLFWDIASEDYYYSLMSTGVNTSVLYEFGSDRLVFGFDFRYDTLKATKKSLQTGDTIWNAKANNYGYWTTLVKRFSNFLTFNPGIRYDYNSSYGRFLSPSFGVVSEINQRLWLKLSVARAFRAPGFNDLFWPIYGNEDLKPEYGNAYELRIESSPIYKIFTATSFFWRNINDRITWLPTREGLWKPQNVNYVKIAGLETEIHTKLKDCITITLDGTYLLARQRNRELVYYDFINSDMAFQEVERTAAFIPPFILSTRLEYEINPNLAINLKIDYTGARLNYYEDWSELPSISMDTKKLKPYLLVNLNLHKRFFEHLGLRFGIKNLFDAAYAVLFGNSIDDRDYPMPRRTVFGEISWE
ncbi:MAG: TonB-dependent receptor [bacterium]